jgi:hypothetical protein
MAADLEHATQAARTIERYAYGLVSEAEGDAEVRSARDVLRLAVGLRRMLERMTTTAQAAGNNAPPAPKEA